MCRLLRFSARNLGLAYIVVSLTALALFAVPLWYAWDETIEHGRVATLHANGRHWAELQAQKGSAALADAVATQVGNGFRDDSTVLLLLVDPAHRKLAGNLPGWPNGLHDAGGVHVTKLDIKGHATRVILFEQVLADGYRLLVGRDIERFERLETLFGAGLAGATAILLCVGVGAGWIVRRSLLFRIRDIDLAARAVMQGDLSHRLPAYVGEKELNALVETENRMLDQMQQLVEGVRNVSNSIAHDLRTPLTELRIRLEEIVLRQPAPEQAFGAVDAAIGDVDRVIGIFNALLRMAEIDSGVRRAGFVTVDLCAIAADGVEFYASLADANGTGLRLSAQAQAFVDGDPLLLAQALGNLIDNALKYGCPAGAIEVGIGIIDGGYVLTVADDGPGIADHDKPKVLERFYRGDTSRSTPGAGLGLSLVETVARLHGGSLSLEDNHPGLRAVLTLPAAAQRAAAQRPGIEQAATESSRTRPQAHLTKS